MKRSLVLLVLPVVMMTGCASEPPAAVSAAATTATATPSPTPTPTATKAATREEQVREVYLNGIYKSEPALRNTGVDNDLVDIGQGFCKMYDGGAMGSDINKFILTAAGWAYTVKQLVAVHGASVGAYCPKYIDRMDK